MTAGQFIPPDIAREVYEALHRVFGEPEPVIQITNVFNDLPPDPACPQVNGIPLETIVVNSPQEPTEAPGSATPLLDEVVAQMAAEQREAGIEPTEGYPKIASFANDEAAALFARIFDREQMLDDVDGHLAVVVGDRGVEAFQRLIARELREMDAEEYPDEFGR